MTLTEFAAEAGYSLNHASQVELGNYNAGPRYLRAAARILNCEITDIADPPVVSATGEDSAASPAENGSTR